MEYVVTTTCFWSGRYLKRGTTIEVPDEVKVPRHLVSKLKYKRPMIADIRNPKGLKLDSPLQPGEGVPFASAEEPAKKKGKKTDEEVAEV